MDAGKRTINDIFNGNRILEIPFFQRSYVWGEEQWERLLEDMETVSRNPKSYFLGSVILKLQDTDSGKSIGDKRTLIDGQQRLTTLCIFFKVLYLKREENHFFNRTFLLANDELALKHNHNDIKSFEKVMNLKELEVLKSNDNVNDHILEAYDFFRTKIEVDKLDISAILNNILFVGIDLGKEEDEQQIFDTINSLGVRLTTAELLKNFFFNRNEISDYEQFWRPVFEKDDETKDYWDREVTTGRLTRTFIDLFFYSYLQIKIQDPELKVRDKAEYSRVETVFESYKSLIKNYNMNRKEILKEIKDYALIFKENFNYDVVENELTNESGIDRINAIIFGLETSTLISYVLFVLKNVQDEEIRNELFQFIEAYIMRRIVVGATTKNYNQLFTDRLITNKILSRSQLSAYIAKSTEQINYLPNDQALSDGFHNSRLINRQSAGILYFIESKIRDRGRQSTQLLGIKKYSLEHLMPKKWVNKWEKLTDPEAIDYRNKKLLTLGNLAIITQSLNASIRDSDWKTKKKGTPKRQGLEHYSAGIETLSPYLKCEEWNEDEIEKRAADLYQMALEIWQIDG